MGRLFLTLSSTWMATALAGPLHPSTPTVVQAEPEDADVRDAIERELLLDDATPSHRLDVAVGEGIAELTGEVGNLLAKERATRIAETVKGVRAVVNRVAVLPGTKTDEELAQDVRAALLSDPAADSYEVTAEVHDGHVVLSGIVDSWQERQLSATVAKGVQGVVGLTNQLQISFDTERADPEIEADVEAALRWNALVDDGLIDTQVEEGHVTLTGTVGSAAEKRLARLDAFVNGVRSVDHSGLQVARWARDEDLCRDKYVIKSSDEVRAAVRDALAADPRVTAFHVEVSSSSGSVTLRGVVDNLKAKRAAEQDARNTVGVHTVRSHLKVRPAEERTSEAIEADVRTALLRDPYVRHHGITVHAHEGSVYLRGSVDSYFEKGQADDIAARVTGVTDVSNQLAVRGRPYSSDPYIDDWSIYTFGWYAPVPLLTLSQDWQIQRDIEHELFWSPFVDADEVTVRVRDGVATLTGTVDSWMERGAARDNAIDGGATRVRNQLEIEPAALASSEASQ